MSRERRARERVPSSHDACAEEARFCFIRVSWDEVRVGCAGGGFQEYEGGRTRVRVRRRGRRDIGVGHGGLV
jgi:hypothetical protein